MSATLDLPEIILSFLARRAGLATREPGPTIGRWQRRRSPLRYAWEPHRHPRDLHGRFVKGMQAHAIGELKHVGGLPVRRHGENEFSVELEKGHKKGTAHEIANHIVADLEKRQLEGKPWIAALTRTEGWTEPDVFADPAGAEHEAAGFAKLPKGARVVSIDPNTIGRMGTVVKGKDGNQVKMDTTGEVVSSVAFEPLNSKQSWRIAGMPAGPRVKQRGLFDEPAEVTEDELPEDAVVEEPEEREEESAAAGGDDEHESIAESLKAAQAAMDERREGYAKKLDALPDGSVVKSGKSTFTAETVDGDRFWKRQIGGKYKGHLSSGDMLIEAGSGPIDKAIEAQGESDDRLDGEGEGGGRAGLPAGQPLGAAAGAPAKPMLPEPGEGPGQGPASVPASADIGGDGGGGPDARSGDDSGVGKGDRVGASAGGAGRGEPKPVLNQTPQERSLAAPPTPENPTDLSAGNFRYTSRDFATGGAKAKFKANLEAIKTYKGILAEGRTTATPEEQQAMSRYIGWGQFPALFGYRTDSAWEKEKAQLHEVLSDAEFDSARTSTLNAHYTDPALVDMHWMLAKKLGYNGGRFLETSAGIGYYLGMMPTELSAKTHSSAVELDSLTGGMLKLLYPDSKVKVEGFQNHQAPPGFYDLIASNVPFGNYKVHDPDFNKHQANIHDYFFLKSAKLAKPGGLIMHITSTGTMDKADSKIRQELAKDCDLVSAIRFPSGAHKEGAGTEVVTDMLILRKRQAGEKPVDDTTPAEAEPKKAGFTGITTDSLGRLYHWVDGKRVPGPNWMDVTEVPDPAGGDAIPVNRYFADHPEQILGTLDRTGTMYHDNNVNVSRTDDYEERLKKVIDAIPADVMKPDQRPKAAFTPEQLPAPGDVKEGGFLIQDGKLFAREGGALVEQPKTNAKQLERIAGMLGIRDAMRQVINDQVRGEDATHSRELLNEAYDAFVEEYGFLNAQANRRAFKTDPDAPPLLALENWNPKGKTATKADMFSKDTIRAIKEATSAADTPSALGVSLHETGRVDIDRMAELTGFSKIQIAQELVDAGIAYRDPSGDWQPADQYLSGNVRLKLALARSAAEADPTFRPNVEALEKVQPEDIDHQDIDVRLGAAWIPPDDVKQFAAFLLDANPEHFEIKYVPSTGEWKADYSRSGERALWSSLAAREKWGAPGKNFIELLESALNNKSVVIKGGMDQKIDPETGKVTQFEAMGTNKKGESVPIVNRKMSEDANAKVQDIKEAFASEGGAGWLWEDDARRDRLHRFYNDNFNNIRTMAYNGQFQTFPGMNPAINVHPHIKDFVWQVVTTGKGLAAHEVGTGKTYAMIASAMELRRLGLAKKPCIACLKMNIEQITADVLKLYPGAKILSTADVFDAASRKKTISQMATGDYDLVLMTHDNLNQLPMKPETEAKYIQEEISDLTAAILARQEEDGGKKKNDRVMKTLEAAKLKLEAKLLAALNTKAKDNAVFFEETGIDQLFVDEAHKYKSLPVYTKADRVKGIPTNRSQRATSMLMRTRWLMEHNGGRGVVFATGTPVANTMAELYTMQRYLQPEELAARGIKNFDAWASIFGDITTKMEKTATGEYKNVARFARFVNIPELMQMVRQVVDVQRADDLKKNMKDVPEEARPKDKEFTGITKDASGKEYRWTEGSTPAIIRPDRHDKVIAAPKSQGIMDLMEELQKRAANLPNVDKDEDNMLVICTDGRKGAMDLRLLDANAPDDPNSKVNQAIRNILDIHKKSPGAVQLIFSDIGVNPSKKGEALPIVRADDSAAEEGDEDEDVEALEPEAKGGFHLYADIINKLVKGGIPREKIADFSKLKGKDKEAAMEAMRKGEIVVGIGSTEKLGTGCNVQNKITAMHTIDVPWFPAAIEQRLGRGIRQGNEFKDVDNYTYVTEGSLDEMMWQIVGTKARFIKQIMTGANTTASKLRTVKEEDSDELTPDQIRAAASGDSRVLEKVNLDEELRVLKAAENRHTREQSKLKDAISRGESNVSYLEGAAKGLKEIQSHLEKNPHPKDFVINIAGKTYTDRKEANEALEAAKTDLEGQGRAYSERGLHLGHFRDMDIHRRGDKMFLTTPAGNSIEIAGNVGSMEYVTRNVPKRIELATQDVERAKANLAKARADIGKPFAKADQLKAKTERARQLAEELRAAYAPKVETPDGPAAEAAEDASAELMAAQRQGEPQRWVRIPDHLI